MKPCATTLTLDVPNEGGFFCTCILESGHKPPCKGFIRGNSDIDSYRPHGPLKERQQYSVTCEITWEHKSAKGEL